MEILRDTRGTPFAGCDFVLRFKEERGARDIRVLQLTDMQVIDAAQRRTPERLRPDEVAAWDSANFDAQCGNHIRSLIAQTRPDLIILTGDLVYGSFDDAGTTFLWFCRLMDSFGIPWAPVFGNHDNESRMGVAWQCEQLEAARYCLFKRGAVSGNGNYTVGLASGDRLFRVIHMLDSNGCRDGSDPAILREGGLYPDQLAMVSANSEKIRAAQGRAVPAFMGFHFPVDIFREAERAKYPMAEDTLYTIGADVPAQDGDFGFSARGYRTIRTGEGFVELLRAAGVDGVFVGHVHTCCSSISYRGIAWTFGLKTGQYDYHLPYSLGGTLITLNGEEFCIRHVPSLVRCEQFPGGASFFGGLFADGEG